MSMYTSKNYIDMSSGNQSLLGVIHNVDTDQQNLKQVSLVLVR